jgi:GH25 family lysozyme M1 (1,4-beta-N-acetylmuramidase)
MSDHLWNILGGDVSFWQGPWNWEIAAAEGWRFAFIRAGSCNSTNGIPYTDHQFMNNAKYAPDHLPVGFYWYFRPDKDPIRQADYFVDLIIDRRWKLPPVMDLESRGNLSPAAVTNSAVKFLAHVYAELKVWCIFYSRSWWLRDFTIYHELFKETDYWVARYTGKAQPYGNPGDPPNYDPPYWEKALFWQKIANSNAAVQYGGLGPPNGDDDVDLNLFNGTEEEFQKYSGTLPPSTPEEYSYKLLSKDGSQIGAGWINKENVKIE